MKQDSSYPVSGIQIHTLEWHLHLPVSILEVQKLDPGTPTRSKVYCPLLSIIEIHRGRQAPLYGERFPSDCEYQNRPDSGMSSKMHWPANSKTSITHLFHNPTSLLLLSCVSKLFSVVRSDLHREEDGSTQSCNPHTYLHSQINTWIK